ncbi:MAG: hypothetical protein R3Y46_08290 [Opitutales bacterium]
MKKIYISVLILIIIGLGAYIAGYNPLGNNKEYNQKVEVIIGENTDANTKAVKAFMDQVNARFDLYIERLKPAIEDKPKWRVLWNHITFDSEEASLVLTEHFNTMVFENQEGDKTLAEIVADLNFAFEENENTMLIKISKDTAQFRLDDKHVDIMSELKAKMDSEMGDIAGDISKNLGITMATSIVAEELARYFIGVPVGAAATTVIASTGGGSVAGPVGTAVGFTVGLATGFFVEMYMDSKNNEKLEIELTNAINEARDKVITHYVDFLNEKVVEIEKSNKTILLK